MKQKTNNEMDLLLRRLGRRDDPVVSGDHLDADALNAYAENALPAAARARYTIHLAECSHCRGLVVQLSSSAGVVAATEGSAVTEPSGFKKFLASLLTPMVLRYAAPALGLIVVAAIGFVVLRREQRSEYVAQDYGNAANAIPSPTQQPLRGFGDSGLIATPSQEGRVENQAKQTAQPAPPPNVPPSVTSVEADVSKDKAAQAKPEEQAAATGAGANEAPPPKPEPTITSQTRAETEVSKNEVKDLTVNTPQAEKALRGAQREDRKADADFARGRNPTGIASAAPATGAGANIQRDGVDDSSASTRTVAGRRFRKQGGVWLDTAYDSSKDAVTVSRGSEQYRALVADEPAIKIIADTLDGEFIVVWKGRTYRIR